jgi:hypothetical protein
VELNARISLPRQLDHLARQIDAHRLSATTDRRSDQGAWPGCHVKHASAGGNICGIQKRFSCQGSDRCEEITIGARQLIVAAALELAQTLRVLVRQLWSRHSHTFHLVLSVVAQLPTAQKDNDVRVFAMVSFWHIATFLPATVTAVARIADIERPCTRISLRS